MALLGDRTSHMNGVGMCLLMKCPTCTIRPRDTYSANNRTIGNEFPYYISGLWADPGRSSRIKEVLDEGKEFSLEDMKALQLDLTSNFSKRFYHIS